MKLYPIIPPQPNFLPVVCWGAPQQGLWPPRYPLTPNTHPGYTGVHPISIGLHPGRMGCTPGDIWTPAGAVMKGVIPKKQNKTCLCDPSRERKSLQLIFCTASILGNYTWRRDNDSTTYDVISDSMLTFSRNVITNNC